MRTKEKLVRLDPEESSYSIGLFIIPQFINDRHLTPSVLHWDDGEKRDVSMSFTMNEKCCIDDDQLVPHARDPIDYNS